MAVIPHRTKNGVRHEMSGAGFHTPAKYTKQDRLNKKELNDILEEETMETIEQIIEVEDEQMARTSWSKGDGYKIVTDQQEITLLISNGQDCCEDWGYLLTEDEADKYIGAELLGIELTDLNRTNHTFADWREEGYDGPNNISLDAGDVMFVDIKTSKGTLQFAAYNGHNGYYGHTVEIVSNQLSFTKGV